MFFRLIGFVLVAVLITMGVRRIIQRRQLRMGQLLRCPFCDTPYSGTPVYCPHCSEVLRSGGSSRR